MVPTVSPGIVAIFVAVLCNSPAVLAVQDTHLPHVHGTVSDPSSSQGQSLTAEHGKGITGEAGPSSHPECSDYARFETDCLARRYKRRAQREKGEALRPDRRTLTGWKEFNDKRSQRERVLRLSQAHELDADPSRHMRFVTLHTSKLRRYGQRVEQQRRDVFFTWRRHKRASFAEDQRRVRSFVEHGGRHLPPPEAFPVKTPPTEFRDLTPQQLDAMEEAWSADFARRRHESNGPHKSLGQISVELFRPGRKGRPKTGTRQNDLPGLSIAPPAGRAPATAAGPSFTGLGGAALERVSRPGALPDLNLALPPETP